MSKATPARQERDTSPVRAPAGSPAATSDDLVERVSSLVHEAREAVASYANATLTMTYWLVGRAMSIHSLHDGRAGVPVIPVHSTRRTCASLLVAMDVHPRVAMAILRRSKIAVTMDIYSQVSSTSTRQALKRLGEAFQ